MGSWFFIIASLCVAAILKPIYNLFLPKLNLPPGPAAFPVLGNLLWLRKSMSEMESILLNLHADYGPIVTLWIGSRMVIFISDNSLAHQALVENGALFADRPQALSGARVHSRDINSSAYGQTWRLLRRNLTAEILHPSRVKAYSHARKWVLDILLSRLSLHPESESVRVADHFRYAMFCLLVLMCFGDKMEEKQIQEIETMEKRLLLSYHRFDILRFWPRVGKIVFRKRMKELLQLRRDQEGVFLPHINARKQVKQDQTKSDNFVLSYVDTLLDLQLPEEKRKLDDEEIVSLCSEFLIGGTDTTSTALQWIMANLVKNPSVQTKIFNEIKETVAEGDVISEEDLQKMRYLKAVVLEGLRRHPPGHFLLPHSVSQDVNLEGYVIPKDGSVNFLVTEMNWNPKIWESPMEFKPERFMASDGGEGEVFDITGSKEIQMMPFGAGRRMCPGYGLAMLHLEYFVANLVWKFEWKAVDGDEVDLSEKQEFTVVMKNPLKVNLSPRWKSPNRAEADSSSIMKS